MCCMIFKPSSDNRITGSAWRLHEMSGLTHNADMAQGEARVAFAGRLVSSGIERNFGGLEVGIRPVP